ncbi:hypothetical protein ONZ45_g9089 [Pleurotus djamor]|nr:hypothetical protein ONZ45_g9089 [Pleurotus djamor]
MSRSEDQHHQKIQAKQQIKPKVARRLHDLYGDDTPDPEGEELTTPPSPKPSKHTKFVEGRYLAFIEKTLATQLNVPPDALPKPKKYDGTPSIEAFDAWFHGFIRWLGCQRCDGPDLDQMRLLLLSCFLEGQALAWFDYVVDGCRSRQGWTFNKAIIALYDRFIPHKAICDAQDLFDGTKYNSKYGVRGFYELLHIRYARIVWPPGRRRFIAKFIKGIPPEVYQGIIKNAECADVYSLPVSKLLDAAILAERIENDDLSRMNKRF